MQYYVTDNILHRIFKHKKLNSKDLSSFVNDRKSIAYPTSNADRRSTSPSVSQCGAPGRHRLYRSSHVSSQAQGPVPSFQFSISVDPGAYQPAQTLYGEAPWLREFRCRSGRNRQCNSVSDSTVSITAVCRCLHWHFKWVCSGTHREVVKHSEREREGRIKINWVT